MKTLSISIISLLITLTFFSCSTSNDQENNSEQIITISGAVRSIEDGKDGYTAKIETKDAQNYFALVSIVNLGGPDKFKRFKIGDQVTLTGVLSAIGGKRLRVTDIVKVETSRTVLLISENAFRGINVGDDISAHLDYIKKDKLKTGEGEFDIYTIKDFNNNPAGYLLPDPTNEKLVGNITVTTKMAETEAGIKVGDTFQVLKSTIPTINVHGSEIEGRTYAKDKTISYRLNTANFSYNIDVEKIPLETAITEIIINRK